MEKKRVYTFGSGKAEGKAELILHILTKRFKIVPLLVEEKLLALTNLDKLAQLADFAIDCQTLAEFENALQK